MVWDGWCDEIPVYNCTKCKNQLELDEETKETLDTWGGK